MKSRYKRCAVSSMRRARTLPSLFTKYDLSIRKQQRRLRMSVKSSQKTAGVIKMQMRKYNRIYLSMAQAKICQGCKQDVFFFDDTVSLFEFGFEEGSDPNLKK